MTFHYIIADYIIFYAMYLGAEKRPVLSHASSFRPWKSPPGNFRGRGNDFMFDEQREPALAMVQIELKPGLR